ncbi:MAG: hypothetical protein ABIR17_05985 [Pseudolysinimonas sp.]|uniref:hypothetical protein n=1 Tax=Pseudolysinimonas sp. TaxID=2680009 RepID=UPI0032675A05
MRVVLQFELDATPDAVWEMLHDPLALGQVLAPLLRITPVGHRRFPPRWSSGEHLTRAKVLGVVPVGDQLIRLSESTRGDARILEDSGGPVSGMLAVITTWRHRMAVSRIEGDRTLYRDRLDFSAGILTPVVWIGIWALWQFRANGIRRVIARRAARP